MNVLVLAGGEGRRLRPYTTVLPKPLMPVGERPILEYLLRQLVANGFMRIGISVGYLSGLIEAYFGNGERLGAALSYTREAEPLGTAGPIRLAGRIEQPILVVNGDILTDLDFGALHRSHLASGAALTVSVFRKQVKIDLGVLAVAAGRVTAYTEKPIIEHPVSMGAYCVSPEAMEFIPEGRRFDLPDLVQALLAEGRPVAAYEHEGYWLDIGRPEDYERAQDEIGTLVGRSGHPGPAGQ